MRSDGAHLALRSALLDGWHACEAWGAWSASSRPRLLLPVPDEGLGCTVRIAVHALTQQDVCIATVGAQPVRLWQGLLGPEAQTLELQLPASPLGYLVIEFQLASTPRPVDLWPDSQDQRCLGVALLSLGWADCGGVAPPGEDTVPAEALVDHRRWDFGLKHALFQAMLRGQGLEQASAAYLRHVIERTGGAEPPDFAGRSSAKTSPEQFLLSARALLVSMAAHGFDGRAAVSIGADGLPLNGAHRIACALALDVRVPVVRHDRAGFAWDEHWFLAQAYSKRDRLACLRALVQALPTRARLFVCWAPAVDRWDRLTASLGDGGLPVAGHVDLAWPEAQRPAYESLVHDIYSHGIQDFVSGMQHIDRKLLHLRGKPCFLRVGVGVLPPHLVADRDHLTQLKHRLREEHDDVVRADQFVTLHVADSTEESMHMAATLLDANNLDACSQRLVSKPRAEFLAWLTAYRQRMHEEALDPEDCCVVGSAVLEVMGIRLSTDIDFTVRSQVRAARYDAGIRRFAGSVDLVTEGYHRRTDARNISDDQLIDTAGHHMRFRGFKFVSVPLVRDRKHFSARPKDQLDIELIDQWTSDRRFLP